MDCKATLEFDLSEQEYDFEVATKGLKLALFIWEMKQEFRAKRKYPASLDGDNRISWGDAEDFFNQSLRESGLDDLIEGMP